MKLNANPDESAGRSAEGVPWIRSRRFGRGLWLFLWALAALSGSLVYSWPRQAPYLRNTLPGKWRFHSVVRSASTVDLSHLGFHTHKNFISFDLRRLHIPAAAVIRVAPHCRYKTSRPGMEPIESYVIWYNSSSAVVVVPTRLADLVALTSLLTGKAYLRRDDYYCEVAWN